MPIDTFNIVSNRRKSLVKQVNEANAISYDPELILPQITSSGMDTHKPPELNQRVIHQSGTAHLDNKRRTTGSIFMTPNVIVQSNNKPNLQHALST